MLRKALSLTVLLASLSAAAAVGSDNTMPGLLGIAGDSNADTKIRTAAIDYLGQLAGNKRLGNDVPTVVDQLAKMLGSPTKEEGAGDFFRWHVIRALGEIGPAAESALVAIANVESDDPTLNRDKQDAVSKITGKGEEKPAAPAAAPGVAPAAPPDPTVVQLGLDLDSTSAAAQLAALKSLAGMKQAALPLLSKITALMKSSADADVRRLAAETAKILVDALLATKTAPAVKGKDNLNKAPEGTEEWLRIYVENVNTMLGDAKHEQQERLFAVAALANVLTQYSADYSNISNYAKGALLTAQSDSDPLVQALAKAVQLSKSAKPGTAEPMPDGKTAPPTK